MTAGHDDHDVHHHGLHGPLQPEKQKHMQSFQYDEVRLRPAEGSAAQEKTSPPALPFASQPWNEQRRLRLSSLTERTRSRIYILRFVLDILIGYAIGALAVAIHVCTHYFSHLRVQLMLDASSEGMGWLINTSLMLGFLMLALLGVIWQPAAGSSGVPAVVAFLNGCNLQAALSPKVWIVKVRRRPRSQPGHCYRRRTPRTHPNPPFLTLARAPEPRTRTPHLSPARPLLTGPPAHDRWWGSCVPLHRGSPRAPRARWLTSAQ